MKTVAIAMSLLLAQAFADPNASQSTEQNKSNIEAPAKAALTAREKIIKHTENWNHKSVKGYRFAFPEDFAALDEMTMMRYNAMMRQLNASCVYDIRLTKPGAPMHTLLGINICILPRQIREEDIPAILADAATSNLAVDYVEEKLSPYLKNIVDAGASYDKENAILYQNTLSTQADGTRAAYCGAVWFDGKTQIEVHGNCIQEDRVKMMSLVSLIALSFEKK